MTLVFAGISLLVWWFDPVGKTHATTVEARSCSKAKTTGAFKAFLAEYNRGDLGALDQRFADEPDFQWYSSGRPGLRSSNAAFNRRSLTRYFGRRHEVGDRMKLRRLDFNGRSGSYSNIGFELVRKANGYRKGEWFRIPGKGAVSCYGNEARFIVISLGAA